MVLILLETLEKFHTYNILNCHPSKHPDVCFLYVSVSLLENELNKEGIVKPDHGALSLAAAQADTNIIV
jgi:hypothetical protein